VWGLLGVESLSALVTGDWVLARPVKGWLEVFSPPDFVVGFE